MLGYKDATNAMKQHCKGVVKHHPLQTKGGMQELRIINEPDMLRLIVGSQLPAAARFEAWVFEDVLPTIRKTGSYSLAPATDEDTIIKIELKDSGNSGVFAALEDDEQGTHSVRTLGIDPHPLRYRTPVCRHHAT